MERLTLSCQKTTEADLDKVVVSLSPERSDFAIDTASLQALQPLLQWLTDVAVYLVASVPGAQNYTAFPGATLLHDAAVLSMLRELLVITYIWGMITSSCLPQLGQASAAQHSTDSLQRLFGAITHLWLCAREGRTDIDDVVLDDCCLLASHLTVPSIDAAMFGHLRLGDAIFHQQHPVKFMYGIPPAYVVNPPPLLMSADGQPPGQQVRDVIRLIQLGTVPALHSVRTCSRCGGSTLADSSGKGVAAAWHSKWLQHCLCGGMWTGGTNEA